MFAVNITDVDSEIRNLNTKELQSFAGMGKLLVKQFDNGEYSLEIIKASKNGKI